jgi:RNA polymerase sigma-70 factor (ECF subfamily)
VLPTWSAAGAAAESKLKLADLDDGALVERLKARDEAAFGALLERYHSRLVRLARHFVPDEASAEAVAQETWMGLLDGLAKFEGRSSLKTYLFRILVNRARTRGVRERRSVPFSALGPADEEGEPALGPERFAADGHWAQPPSAGGRSPEEALLGAETLSLLTQALATLPEQQRAVVTMRDVEGLGSDEVCNILEISETNQRVLLHRGRSKLRALLEEHLSR